MEQNVLVWDNSINQFRPLKISSINGVNPLIKGYYHDGNFYSDSGYTQTLKPNSDYLYLDINSNVLYSCDGFNYAVVG
ncbi:hypothetical protein GO491_11835, partial [Flavobacteriaceae bacterium Ap0902]|nr:hypothetical protein [Flavobacteriaceae bacterium Ap0902]